MKAMLRTWWLWLDRIAARYAEASTRNHSGYIDERRRELVRRAAARIGVY